MLASDIGMLALDIDMLALDIDMLRSRVADKGRVLGFGV